MPTLFMAYDPAVEAVWCKISLNGITISIGAVYRPTHAQMGYLKSLYDCMHEHVTGGAVIIAAEFNLPDVNLECLSTATAMKDRLSDCLFTFNLTHINATPTREPRASTSLLDLIFVSDHFPINKIATETLEWLRDHKMVSCCLPVPCTARMPGPDKGFLQHFRSTLSLVPFRLKALRKLSPTQSGTT